MPRWWFDGAIKFIAPVVLAVFFVWNLVKLLQGGGYGGYPMHAQIIGGWLISTIVLVAGFVMKIVVSKNKKLNERVKAVEAEEKSMKSQMRSADRLKAARVLIVGDSELDSGTAVLKQMSDGSQRQIALNAVKEELFK